ncbi:MAG: pyridoxine 5'-phosphate synthase [Desulfobacterales bacterium]
MPGLIVNLDRVAALRNHTGTSHPDPAAAAVLAELGGARGVSVHYRPDRPESSERDLRILREITQGRLVLGMSPTSEMMGLALDVKPDAVTLMMDPPPGQQSPSTVDLILDQREIGEIIASIQGSGIPVLILVEPDPDQVKNAHRLNADGVQLHTGAYITAVDETHRRRLRDRIVDAAKLAAKLRLGITAGCGLTYSAAAQLSRITEIEDCVVGHGIVSRALFIGVEAAVREMVIQLDQR